MLPPANFTISAQYVSRSDAGNGGANDTTTVPMEGNPLVDAYRDASCAEENDLIRSWSVTTDSWHPADRHSKAVVSSGLVAPRPARVSSRTMSHAVGVDRSPSVADARGVPCCFRASDAVLGGPVMVLPQLHTNAVHTTAIIDFAYRAFRTN
jgi:hypothetical protein